MKRVQQAAKWTQHIIQVTFLAVLAWTKADLASGRIVYRRNRWFCQNDCMDRPNGNSATQKSGLLQKVKSSLRLSLGAVAECDLSLLATVFVKTNDQQTRISKSKCHQECRVCRMLIEVKKY